MTMGRPRQDRDSVIARAIATAEQTDQGCLIVTAWKPMVAGYVRVGIAGQQILIHRLILGDIPDGLTVDHECHNRDRSCPGNACIHRRCIEPSHLFVRPQGPNWERGRLGVVAQRRALTHCPHGHPYEEANLRGGIDHRACKACARARAAGRDPNIEPTYL